MNKTIIAVFATTLLLIASASGQDKKAPAKAEKFTGRVSDAKCGNSVDAECNKKCFGQGEAPVLVLDGSGAVLNVKNGDDLKKYPGAHVTVTGTKSGDVITVSKVAALKN